MKKILSIVAIILFVFSSCDSGDFVGGRYYGTFHNNLNNLREAGSLTFTYCNKDGETFFLMNDLVTMGQIDRGKFVGIAEGSVLNDLLKTIPAIDSIQVCDSLEAAIQMSVEAEFKGSSVKTNLTFTTTHDKTVMVDFIGYFE